MALKEVLLILQVTQCLIQVGVRNTANFSSIEDQQRILQFHINNRTTAVFIIIGCTTLIAVYIYLKIKFSNKQCMK